MTERLRLCLALLFLTLLTVACARATRSPADPWQELRQADGSVLWLGEYRFVPPPNPWCPLDLNERDLSLALFKPCGHGDHRSSPCVSTMAYAEEPFGYSKDLEQRSREFLKRYLWAARVVFAEPHLTDRRINDKTVLAVDVTGEEPVTHARVRSRIIFMHRGDRVVAFFVNQWRDRQTPFSSDDFEAFDRLVDSFTFVKSSFYEAL